jgi:hypothetical protein
MNENINNFDKVDEELHDDWLNENLKLVQVEPPLDFTKKVMEKVEVKPNPLSNSPVFWILAIVPGIFLVWLIMYGINTVGVSYQSNLDFIPKVSNLVTLTTLSKYVIMIVIGGIFFIGLDYFLSNRLSHRESFFNFLVV